MLRAGGRVAILTFHSGEDRRVKKALKAGFNEGQYAAWGRDVRRASPEERRANPRSKCAKLRWAVKSGGVEGVEGVEGVGGGVGGVGIVGRVGLKRSKRSKET